MEKTIEKQQSLLFTMKPLSFEKMGDKLIRVTCYLLGTGINRNGSNITKNAIIKANEKLSHLPVVGHLIQDEDGNYYMGGHDVKIEDKGRDWSIEPLTVALGCIAGDKKFEFVKLKEFEGTEKEQEREYLKVDMIIWNHMSSVFEAAYSKDVYFNHSIEIDQVDGVWDTTNNFRIDSFQYDRACLLGLSDDHKKHVEPCFPESKVYPTDYNLGSDFNKQFSLLIQEIKKFNEFNLENQNSNLNISDNNSEQNQKKEDDKLANKKEISFADVCTKIKLLMSETTYDNKEVNKRYEKYIVLSSNESDNTITVVDREVDYKAYSIPYIASQTDEGVVVNIDYENKKELMLGAVDKADAIFNVNDEVSMIAKDTSAYDVGVFSSNRINELMTKLDEKTAEFVAASSEVEKLTKQLAIFENEKQQYMAQKHKDMIDTLIASRRDEMGKYSEFLEYCNEVDYSKTVEQIQSELKEVHYNFMLKNRPNGKKSFSVIETNVIDDTSGGDSLNDRWDEDVVKHLKKNK